MTDDIVTRLRGYDFMRDGDTPEVIMTEAADEIERLREWKQIANMFGQCFRMDEFSQFPTSNDGDVLQAVNAWEYLRTKEVRQ
jgi:hypothetical protein